MRIHLFEKPHVFLYIYNIFRSKMVDNEERHFKVVFVPADIASVGGAFGAPASGQGDSVHDGLRKVHFGKISLRGRQVQACEEIK